MPRKPLGRPMKYDVIIEALDEETVYSPAAIARFAKSQGLLDQFRQNDEDDRLLLLRIRIAMARFSDNHEFPPEGDGILKLKGHR